MIEDFTITEENPPRFPSESVSRKKKWNPSPYIKTLWQKNMVNWGAGSGDFQPALSIER